MFTVERLVIVKQILALLSNGLLQSAIRVGISFGLKDTAASTITIGLDLEMDMVKNMNVTCLLRLDQTMKNQTPN